MVNGFPPHSDDFPKGLSPISLPGFSVARGLPTEIEKTYLDEE